MFTGGTATAGAVADRRRAGGRLARYTLELGGKSPNVVFADADLDAAIEGVVGGIFAAAGQTCIAGSRVLVEASIDDEFTRRLVERTGRIVARRPAAPRHEVGPIASPRSSRKSANTSASRRTRARLLAAARRREQRSRAASSSSRRSSPPSCRRDRIAREEVFGPVASVLSFTDEDDAARMANDTEFGLGAGVWTKDLARACG